MSTLIAVGILVVIGFLGALFWPTILSLAAMPGAIIGSPFGKLVDTRFVIGILVATAVQSYIYLAFVGLVIAGTKYYIHQGALSPIFVWPASFIACALPMWVGAPTSVKSGNPLKIMAAGNTSILAVIGFFVFAFFPKLFALGWPWVFMGVFQIS
jgi:hypothetical protein